MKRTLTLCALLWNSFALAATHTYDVTALGGVVFPDDETHLENQPVYGGALQYNGFEWFINPELQVLQSTEVDFDEYPNDDPNLIVNSNPSTFVNRILLNGVHDFDLSSIFTPYLKLGAGYESFHNYHFFENDDSAVADLGAGLKVALTDAFSLRVEGLGMYKFNDRGDINYGVLGGLTFSFGTLPSTRAAEKAAAEKAAAEREAAEREAAQRAAAEKAEAERKAAEAAAAAAALAAATRDSDNDGIPDVSDKCPNSVEGFAVDDDGCELAPSFTFSFPIGSSKIPAADQAEYLRYGEYVKRNDLGLLIVGHTDNTGPETFNRKLSLQRAQGVAKLIEKAGVPAEKISVEGRGDTEPVMSNKSAEGRAANRRVELIPQQ